MLVSAGLMAIAGAGLMLCASGLLSNGQDIAMVIASAAGAAVGGAVTYGLFGRLGALGAALSLVGLALATVIGGALGGAILAGAKGIELGAAFALSLISATPASALWWVFSLVAAHLIMQRLRAWQAQS